MQVDSTPPPASRQPAEVTTGTVWSEPLAAYGDPPTLVNRSHFEPGARTCWHVHRLGQVLIVESGLAVVQEEGARPVLVGTGGRVLCPPGVRHWHGAAAETTMTQLAITPADRDGSFAVWERHVSDEEYCAR